MSSTTSSQKGEENITPKQLVEIIKNYDKKYQYGGKDYVLIIKEETNDRCILYVCDCEEAIWSKILDLNYFLNLRKQLHLTSSIKIFAQHFVSSLQASSVLQKVKSSLKIHIELQIGEGLVMSCNILVDSRVHYNNPDEFKKHLQRFIVYLWQVKSSQISNLISKSQSQKRQKQQKQKLERQKDKSKSMFVLDNKSKRISLKHRDLVNPQRKKRKKNGAKLGSGFQQYTTTLVNEKMDDFQL